MCPGNERTCVSECMFMVPSFVRCRLDSIHLVSLCLSANMPQMNLFIIIVQPKPISTSSSLFF